MNVKTKKILMSLLWVFIYFAIFFLSQLSISFLLSFVVMLISAIAGSGGFVVTEETMNNAYYSISGWIEILFGIVMLLILWIVFNFRNKNIIEEIKLKKINVSDGVAVAVMGIFAAVAISLAINVIPFPESWVQAHDESVGSMSYSGFIVALIATVVVAPILEEITFRALMFSKMNEIMPKLLSVAISSAIFGIVHGNIIQALYAGVLGILLAFVFDRFDSVVGAVILHMAFNFAGMFAGLFIGSTLRSNIITIIITGVIAIGCGLYVFWLSKVLNEKRKNNSLYRF